jgi:hypothetical protein
MELRDHLNLIEASTRPAKLETTPLPYTHKDLEPVMSAETIDYHYEHLAKGYADATTQEKAMRILIVLVVFYTISFSPNFGLLKAPTVHVVQYWH